VLIIYDEYEPIKHRPFFCCICGTKWKSIKNSKPMMVFNQSLSEKKAGRSVFVCLNHKSPLTMLREPFSMLKSLPAIIRYTRHDKKPLR
jgi:ribosomal protein L34E